MIAEGREGGRASIGIAEERICRLLGTFPDVTHHQEPRLVFSVFKSGFQRRATWPDLPNLIYLSFLFH
jgi:hypothetical protein